MGRSLGLPSAWRRARQRHFIAMPPSMAASLEPVVEQPEKIVASRDDALSPVDDGLSDAFGDDKSFTETMTGIVSSVTKSFTREKDTVTPSSDPVASGGSGGSLLRDPKVLGGAAIALEVVVAVVGRVRLEEPEGHPFLPFGDQRG